MTQASELRYTNTVLHALFRFVALQVGERLADFREQLHQEETTLAELFALLEEEPEPLPELDADDTASAWENVARSVCLALLDTLRSNRGVWTELRASEWAARTISNLDEAGWSELVEDTGLSRSELALSLRIGAEAVVNFDWFVSGEKLRSSAGELLVQTSPSERLVSWFFTSRRIFGLLTTGSGGSRMSADRHSMAVTGNEVSLFALGASSGLQLESLPAGQQSVLIGAGSHQALVSALSDLEVSWNVEVVAHAMPEGLVLEGDATGNDLVAQFRGCKLAIEFGVPQNRS